MRRADSGRPPSRSFPWARLAALAVCAHLILLGADLSARPSFDAGRWRRLLSQRGFSTAETRSVLAAFDRAGSRGIPGSLLEGRVQEGLARGAGPSAIQRVIDRRLNQLVVAAEIVRRGGGAGLPVRDRESTLARLADSLGMGVTPEDVGGLLPAAAAARRDVDAVSRAAEVMGRLARQGTPPAESRATLRAAIAAGWTREQMDGLPGVFGAARRLGVDRVKTAEILEAGIRRGESVRGLAAAAEAAARPQSVSPRAGSEPNAAPRRSASSRPAAPKSGKGAAVPRSVGRPPSRGAPPRAPAPRGGARPHGPRGPAHRPRP